MNDFSTGFLCGVIAIWLFLFVLMILSQAWKRAIEREVSRREREKRTAEWEASKLR